MTRLPNSPHNGRTPAQIATADRRMAAVRQVVDELLANTTLPPTRDRTEAVVSLHINQVTDTAMAVCLAVGAPIPEWIDSATSAVAAELLYRLLEARAS